MIQYFLELLENIKTNNSFNFVKQFKGSVLTVSFIRDLSFRLNRELSQKEGFLYRQHISSGISVLWKYIDGVKTISEIKTSAYEIIVGLKTFILKSFSNKIKDIRFEKETGDIKMINFKPRYFINCINYKTGKASLSIEGVNIKSLFNKNKLSELSYDEWCLLELNTSI